MAIIMRGMRKLKTIKLLVCDELWNKALMTSQKGIFAAPIKLAKTISVKKTPKLMKNKDQNLSWFLYNIFFNVRI